MPVFTYEEIMEAARQTELDQSRRKQEALEQAWPVSPGQRANMARDILDNCPETVREYQSVPSLKRNTLQRVVCALADGYTEIHIGLSGAWSARTASGASVTAYEKLDYHSGCREFLEAMRAAGVPIVEHGYSVKL